MTIGFVFWLLMLLWLVFGLYRWRMGSPPAPPAWLPYGDDAVLFLLLFLLGWQVFGFPIRG